MFCRSGEGFRKSSNEGGRVVTANKRSTRGDCESRD